MAPPDSSTSTTYSADRYAHPFFLPASHTDREAFDGHVRMTDWSKEKLGPVPPVVRHGRIELSDIIGADGAHEITDLGEIRFHALGDSGVGHAIEAEHVAEDMATDFKAGAGALNPAFLFHLGDVIYGPQKDIHYGERFYRPYRHYPGKIIAIPGNHDGEVKSPQDSPSLKSFRTNFCAASAEVPDQASGSGIFRQTMTLPGVYWYMEAPFVRIIALYSNLLENPGYLQGKNDDGSADLSQLEWLGTTLKAIAKLKEKKALVIATHHPPFSQSGHSGSFEMSRSIDELCEKAGVVPHLFLSAHAHSYQRYTRRIAGKQVLYIVAGTGGMPPQNVPPATGQPIDSNNQTTYDAAVASLGYLFVTASAHQIKTEFWQLGGEHTTAFDTATVDLATHTLR
jgi:Calcineurin-like phosphoesterase